MRLLLRNKHDNVNYSDIFQRSKRKHMVTPSFYVLVRQCREYKNTSEEVLKRFRASSSFNSVWQTHSPAFVGRTGLESTPAWRPPANSGKGVKWFRGRQFKPSRNISDRLDTRDTVQTATIFIDSLSIYRNQFIISYFKSSLGV